MCSNSGGWASCNDANGCYNMGLGQADCDSDANCYGSLICRSCRPGDCWDTCYDNGEKPDLCAVEYASSETGSSTTASITFSGSTMTVKALKINMTNGNTHNLAALTRVTD